MSAFHRVSSLVSLVQLRKRTYVSYAAHIPERLEHIVPSGLIVATDMQCLPYYREHWHAALVVALDDGRSGQLYNQEWPGLLT